MITEANGNSSASQSSLTMERFLKPDRFDTDPNSSKAAQKWMHWFKTFENFLTSIGNLDSSHKLKLLINYVSHSIYELISECDTYDSAIDNLKKIYVKQRNDIFARHQLSTRKQIPNENIDQYLQALKLLAKECNFISVSAEDHRDFFIRDTFINGLLSTQIRQRLLENRTLTLKDAEDQARSLESAQKQSEVYSSSSSLAATVDSENLVASSSRNPFMKCYFCGNKFHERKLCPAKDVDCGSCGKRGHFQKVCRSRQKFKQTSASLITENQNSVLAAAPKCLSKSLTEVFVNKILADALIDTGSSETYLNESFIKSHHIQIFPSYRQISMASTALQSTISGHCFVDLEIQGHFYPNMKISIIPDLCADVIIGHDILSQYSKIEINFGGLKSSLSICSLTMAKVDPPQLFSNLSSDCKPIAIKSRRHTAEDRNFISEEVRRLLSEGIIVKSNSPWRAQALVTKNEKHKKRMVIDYSQTINRYTFLDAYPLPRIEDIVNEVSKHRVFSTIDLRSAYHQLPLKKDEEIFTAFEADNQLYQFKRVPFGVTNGVACFQRVIDNIIQNANLSGVYAYLDDVTICGKTEDQHNENLQKFLNVCKTYNLTINYEKSNFCKQSIKLLGYLIENGTIKPDPARLEALLNIDVPRDTHSLQRVVGMFSHYSRWIPRFSEKIYSLINSKTFPLSEEAISNFETIKKDIADSVVTTIDENVPFVVETDASEHAIAACLSQNGKPVAFFTRMLSQSEQRLSAVEKEAYAIVESLKKWRHYLIGRHFQLITDQKSVSFMFNTSHTSKIKNEKILRWKLELACYNYDIIYRPGKSNTVADTFSRICSASVKNPLFELHQSLCHPGVTRMNHWIRTRNLPYSIEDIRKMTSDCPVCAEIKSKFYQSRNKNKLIKSTAPLERLNIDFKGPLPTCTENKYLLTIVDEYSRFPFGFSCRDMTSNTVKNCLEQIFSIFGMPSYIHSDQGSSFMSEELRNYLHCRGIATSRTTPYNPEGNGQVERYNGIIWKSILLALKSRGLEVNQWEMVLSQTLHSIRSLLCTATNCTPHERMFYHARKSSFGNSIPSWLTCPGPVLVKKHVRKSKYDPLVEEAYLIEANPDYALVQFSSGREANISLKHLAPRGDVTLLFKNDNPESDMLITDPQHETITTPHQENCDRASTSDFGLTIQSETSDDNENPRELMNTHSETMEDRELNNRICVDPGDANKETRPTRERQPPKHLNDFILN